MEIHLDRYLNKDETVDHIDGNFLNNDLDNLQILSRREHTSLDVLRRRDLKVRCFICDKEFIIPGSTLGNRQSNTRKYHHGYFCSRSCSGKYGKMIQTGEMVHQEVSVKQVGKFKKKNECPFSKE